MLHILFFNTSVVCVERPVDTVCVEKVVQVLTEVKTVRPHGRSCVSLELVAACRNMNASDGCVMSESYGWIGMPVEWALGIVVPIFKGKGDIRYCSH